MARRPHRLDYKLRNSRLKGRGFATYQEYLASPEWAAIRKKVLERDGGKCVLCHAPATQVHHKSYAREVLGGWNLDGLASLCGSCHRIIERRPDGEKRHPREVDKMFKRRKKALAHRREDAKLTPSPVP